MSLTVQLKVLVRSLPAAFSKPPCSSWSRTQRLFVEATRQMLQVAKRLPAQEQRRQCRPPPEALPRGVSRTELSLSGRKAYRYATSSSADCGLILHLHGGGYVIGGADVHNSYLGRLSTACGVPVISLDYRLAPEHPFPAALDDASAAVRALVAQGSPASSLVLAGDSAGAGLALATLVRLRDEGAPALAGAILGSAWTDVTCPGLSMQTNANADCFDGELAALWAALYCGPDQTRTPLVSPAYAELGGLPPLLFMVGDLEVLRDDTVNCANRAKASGVDAELVLGADAVHCWYVTNGLLPGPQDTVPRIAQFVSRVIGRG